MRSHWTSIQILRKLYQTYRQLQLWNFIYVFRVFWCSMQSELNLVYMRWDSTHVRWDWCEVRFNWPRKLLFTPWIFWSSCVRFDTAFVWEEDRSSTFYHTIYSIFANLLTTAKIEWLQKFRNIFCNFLSGVNLWVINDNLRLVHANWTT